MEMTAPLYSYNLISYNLSLILAVIIGFVFGFLLERAGLGNPRKLTAIFYLEDFTLVKVIFSAIVTSAIGLWVFRKAGVIDISRVLIMPTYLWPQLLGGIILGMGFVIGGYCPGTSVVGLSSGRIDAVIFFIGLMLGIWLFAEGYPYMERFYLSGYMGDMTLYRWFNTSAGKILLVMTLLAFISFWIAEKIEKG